MARILIIRKHKTNNMKRYYILAFYILFIAGTATAQTISGKVTDAEAHPIDGATVILQSIDSTFVDALITDSTGCFRFNRHNIG